MCDLELINKLQNTVDDLMKEKSERNETKDRSDSGVIRGNQNNSGGKK